ncbi:MAG: D-2-hydroxyacid dehydrogenase, partial [Planctomycetales bacterium]
TRGIFNDHLSHHAIGMIISHSRHWDYYAQLQAEHRWSPAKPIKHLPGCALLLIGCGEAGQATAALAKAMGMTVLATDPRVKEAPCVDEIHPPEALMELLPRADYVVMIVPETPATLKMMAAEQFAAMKPGSYLINLGRGATLVLDDLVSALKDGPLEGASLDVFEVEPLPRDHPLWDTPNVRITPHVSGEGPHCWERRLNLIIDNCRLFAAEQPLKNIVDKKNWF